MKTKVENRLKRHKSIKGRIATGARARLMIFRSNSHIYAHIIDDKKGVTLLGASDISLETKTKMTKVQKAFEVGKEIAKKAKEQKITSVVFDRAGFLYHGRVKSLAEGAREGGLEF